MWMAISCLASMLLGFALGRRLGIVQGFELGVAYGRLDLRRQSLEKGKCAICMLEAPNTGESDKEGQLFISQNNKGSNQDEGSGVDISSCDI